MASFAIVVVMFSKIVIPRCRFPPEPFDVHMKGQIAHALITGYTGEAMPQYLVCNYLPDDFDPSTVTEAMMEEIHALNREMIAAGVRKFACGISPVAKAKTLRKQPDGKVLITDGPYIEGNEVIGGFVEVDVPDLDAALRIAKTWPGGAVEIRPVVAR